MKKILLVLSVLLLASASYAADVTGSFSTMPDSGMITGTTRFSNGASFGFLNQSGTSAAVFRWNPDFNYNGLGVGLDVNIPLNAENPVNIDSLVIRYIKYETPAWGIKYGILNNVTFGNGLLINNYSTNAQGSILQSDQQSGAMGYANYNIYGLQYLATWSQIYAVRLTEQVLPNLTLGQYYVTDYNGVNYVKPDGTSVTYPSQSGFGIDATYPIWGSAKLFAEYAHLNGHGSGATAGFGFETSLLGLGNASFKAERRFIQSNFVPGYFDADYEINPINIVSYEATSTDKDGYAVTLAANVLGKGDLYANLESYNGSNAALTAIANAQLTDDYFVSASLTQPNFVDSRSLDVTNGAIITGRLGYKVNPFTMVIVNYKKAYDAVLGQVVESQWYEMSFAF